MYIAGLDAVVKAIGDTCRAPCDAHYRDNQGERISMPCVKLKLLGPFRSSAGESRADGSRTFELAPGARLGDALMCAELPADVPRVVLLNGVQRSDNPALDDDDCITVFPPIAGGSAEKAWIH